MADFIDIVMEARKKKSKAKEEPAAEEEDDLPEDDGAPEDMAAEAEESELPEDDGEPEDLAAEAEADEDDTVESETEETDDAETTGDDLPPEDGEPEDMSADADTEDAGAVDTGETEGGDDLPPEDGEPEDMSADADTEDAGDGTDTSMDESSTDDTSTEEQDDPRSRRLLQEDFTVLYFKTKDFLAKLATLDKSDIILNQVVTQIDKNLTRLKTILWDFIVYDFDKNDMVTNLYRYNQFVEVFKVNLDMLSKGKDFVLKIREETAEQSKKRHRTQ